MGHGQISKQIQKKRPRRVGDSNVAGPLCCSLVEREDLALAGAAEQLDLLLALVDDGLSAGSQQLAGVEALALLILASLDVLAGGLSEDQLALGVDVDLGLSLIHI